MSDQLPSTGPQSRTVSIMNRVVASSLGQPFLVILMTLVGGMGTFYGPVVGALIVVAMQNYLAQFGEWVTVIQGVVFVACVLAFRRGIVGELAARAKVSL